MRYLRTFEGLNIDEILDKISAGGVGSLSDVEREFLYSKYGRPDDAPPPPPPINNNNNNNNNNNMRNLNPSDWYFDVLMSNDPNCPSCIALSLDGNSLDDSLGSYNLPQNIINALNNAGIFGDSELQEAIWEVNDYENKSRQDIINSMENEGFIYSPGIF